MWKAHGLASCDEMDDGVEESSSKRRERGTPTRSRLLWRRQQSHLFPQAQETSGLLRPAFCIASASALLQEYLQNKVHTEEYLKSLKSSFRIAAIVESHSWFDSMVAAAVKVSPLVGKMRDPSCDLRGGSFEKLTCKNRAPIMMDLLSEPRLDMLSNKVYDVSGRGHSDEILSQAANKHRNKSSRFKNLCSVF
ncbi:hypothetical protein EJB05_15429 [Eragrostis curvula]|uniref:Uncharacterized protein n=1 Tax=Eragrostis curvula TaxID=38414 RepID=A0A5J9VZJ1_9POAL|nr:hypothetical protein EJB05_15402 [Eragrostis curvula]TVU41872.1 hypothetical protein EJB05_15429 [Eragrostis curvula]